MKPLRDLLKHSSVYALGQILTRIASILLLPLYTYCLSPADYGVTAILDLTAVILSMMIGGGMSPAVTRYHFDEDDERHHDRVWWTGLTYITVASAAVLAPMWIIRQTLSDLTLGHEISDGPWFYTLTFLLILIQSPGHLLETYLRVQKWSGMFVGVSFARLLINVGLNVWFLVGLKLGVGGLLIGNLTATVLHTAVLLAIFVRHRGRFCLNRSLAGHMFRFSVPMIVTTLLATIMHEADRYILRAWSNLEQVGVYALAHKIGFAVYTLCLMSYSSIWHVAIYDIERLPDAQKIYAKVFTWFVGGLGVIMLGAALTVHPVLPLLTPEAYGPAIDLIAVILLGFFFFGMVLNFEVPSLLSKRTDLLLPGAIAGAAVNVGANLFLIPRIGAWGAAWAGVVTYIVFAGLVLATSRSVMKIPYQWGRCLLVTLGISVTYVAVRWGLFPRLSSIGQIAVSVAVCGAWAIGLFAKDGLQWWAGRRNALSDEAADLRCERAAESTEVSQESDVELCASGT
ncbi:MAG: oligosaccharide flippase family protein [Planctomycetaceae bacterium]|nr:oligosaccharide flippase family protein [Planctomycetaceae bacterium]